MLRRLLIPFALACCFVLAPSTVRPPSAYADTPVDAGTTADAGSGSGSATPAPAPHDTLKDPTADPKGAIGDLQDAKKKGWVALLVIGLYMAVRLAGKLGKNVTWLKWLDAGRPAMVIAAGATVLASCTDVAMNGGNPLNIGVAALIGVVGLLHSHPADPNPPAS